MSIASEITRLQEAKVDIMAALVEKGVDVTGKNLVDVPDLIDSIEVGPKTVRIGEHDYPYVKIGNLYWLAENLDLLIPNITYRATAASIDNSSTNAQCCHYQCDNATYGYSGLKYGMLYSLTDLGIINNYLNQNMAGWRVPSIADYTNLVNNVSSNLDLYSKDKGGTNASGYNGIYGGRYMVYQSGDKFADMWEITHRVTDNNIVNGYIAIVGKTTFSSMLGWTAMDLYPIRLVKDA